jgi:hypothetical protein
MFEKRSEKQLIVIYVLIALFVSFFITIYNLSPLNPWSNEPLYIIVAANIIFFCIFYILYLPLKIKRGQK